MSLLSQFKKQNWNALEESWTELMLGDASLEGVFDVLDAAASSRQMARCVPLVKEHAGMLASAGRAADACELLGSAMLGGGSPGELAKPLWEQAVATWSDKPWWPAYAELAGLTENAPDMRAAWGSFRKLLALDEGTAVFHGRGWGIGLITSLRRMDLEIDVRFHEGRRDRFPLASAIEIFEILPPHDLRSLVVRDPDELKRRLREEPLDVLRALLKRYQNRANQALLKTALGQCGIAGPAFSAWWRRAKKEADSSEWFEVIGSGTKTQVRVLTDASDPALNLRRQLRNSTSLVSALQRVRDLFGHETLSNEMRAAALETLETLASDDAQPEPHRMVAWLFLGEATGSTPEPLLARLRAAAAAPEPASPADPPALWSLLQTVPGAREHESAFAVLPEILGDDWLEICARQLPHVPPGLVRPIVEAMLSQRSEQLVAHYNFLLARLTLNPSLLIHLAELVESGKLRGNLPEPVRRAQAYVQLSTHLQERSSAAAPIARARTRLAALVAGSKPTLLRRLFEGADRDVLRATLTMIRRGVDDVIESAFGAVVVELDPDLFRLDEKPFWADGRIWTTRAGLAKRESELKELTQVKIPENSEAIGRAAALGDLSENSEWESAMEEQRILTARATEIEAELRQAALIDNAPLIEDVATPGTTVRYREVQSGEVHRVTLLGPWDTDRPGVISYRSPLAQGLLGLMAGDRSQIELPSGTFEVELLAIETS